MSPAAEVAKQVRKFVGQRGRDEKGNRVIAHAATFTSLTSGVEYAGTVVYESREWAREFVDWYDDGEWLPGIEVEALSSFEVGVRVTGPPDAA